MTDCDAIDITNQADETMLKLERINAVLSVLFSGPLTYDPKFVDGPKGEGARRNFSDEYNEIFTMTHIMSDYIDSVVDDMKNISTESEKLNSRIRAAKASL